MKAPTYATLGDNCIDRFAAPVSRRLVGGNAVNVAVHLARLGLGTAYFGAVGHDPDGEFIRACLAARGVDVTHLRRLDAPTAYTDIVFGSDGERIFAHEEFGASGLYKPDHVDLEALAGMRHVHIGFLQDEGRARRFLVAHGVSVSQDLSVNSAQQHRLPDGLSIAFASAGPDITRARTILDEMLASGAVTAVVSCGVAGSIASDGETVVQVAARQVDATDTTGAGDTFAAAFIAAHLSGQSLQQSLERARDEAAVTCTHAGGFRQETAETTLT